MIAQLHSHHSILYMSTVVDKVISLDDVVFRSCYLAYLVMIPFFFILHQLKSELDKLLEAKDQVLGLYESMEKEQPQFAAKEKEYGDKLNKIGMELNTSLSSKLKLQEENEALKIWGQKANQRAEVKKMKTEEERAQSKEAIKKVGETNERAKAAIKKVEDAEAKAIKAVKSWRESTEFNALDQDAYIVALEKLIKHVRRERPKFDSAFLDEAQEEQKKEL